MKLVEEKPVTLVEAKKILEKLAKERSELGYEQKVTLDFLKTYVQLNKKSVDEARKELHEKLPELKEHQIVMLLNILPETEEDVKVIFSKERIEMDDTKIKQILEILDKIRPAERIKYKAFSGVGGEESRERKEAKEQEAVSDQSGEEEQA